MPMPELISAPLYTPIPLSIVLAWLRSDDWVISARIIPPADPLAFDSPIALLARLPIPELRICALMPQQMLSMPP